MRINLLSVEDGLDNIGFRKLTAYVRGLCQQTSVYYVMTGNNRALGKVLAMRGVEPLQQADIELIADRIAAADLVGFSSMTPYAAETAALIAAVRRRNPAAIIVWGGIHAIIEPENAIMHADAVCTGEGEFAFQALLEALQSGRSIAATPGFWVNTPQGVVRNRNLPLMTGIQMDALPLPTYQSGELIYRQGKGFSPAAPLDYINWCGLAYNTVWSVGCPMNCIYCGNSKFIEYDREYRNIRHSSPATIVAEIKDAQRKHPHISTIVFHDDSFMALPVPVLEEFCRLYGREIALPFAVIGLGPNYVTEEKMKLLVAAGMNRVRMGIQSGSQRILDFYERSTSVERIMESCRIINRFSNRMIPPAYDIILDNPLETKEDTLATLNLISRLPRPFTLNLFALRVIPNTRLAESLTKMGIELPDIRLTLPRHQPTLANILIYLLILCRVPHTLYRKLCVAVLPAHLPQRHYPLLLLLVRLLYLSRRAFDHLRFMDFSVLTGRVGYLFWKCGIVGLWQRRCIRQRREAG